LPIHPGERRAELILAGEVPSPINPPSGCRFHPRCPRHAMPQCARREPPLDVAGSGLVACHLYGAPATEAAQGPPLEAPAGAVAS
jgi:oligopeptide/dipeptide ABC transporter ATP-binding protein